MHNELYLRIILSFLFIIYIAQIQIQVFSNFIK
jgi:hypothetical protein